MKTTKRPPRPHLDAGATRELLDKLFANELEPEEQEATLTGADPVAARSYLVERLVEGGAGAEARLTIPMLFDRFGLGDTRERVIAIVSDHSIDITTRATATNILMMAAPEEGAELLFSFSASERDAILRQSLADLIIQAICSPDMRGVIADFVLRTDANPLEPFAVLDQLRRSLGVAATPLYSVVLARRGVTDELRDRLLNAVAADASIAAVEYLERLEKKRGWRQHVRRALMRVRTAIAERPAVAGWGHLSPWENGTWFAGVEFDAGGTRLTAGLEIDHGEVVDGYAAAGVDSMTALAWREVPFAEMTPEEVFAAVEQAIRNTSAKDLNTDARAAIEVFERVSHAAELVTPRPAAALDGRSIESLLGRPEYQRWMFTVDQLEAADVEPPDQMPPSTRWKEDALRKLAAAGAGENFSAGADYMARWHAARQEHAEAAVVAKLGIDFRRKFEQSAVVRRLLERSVEELSAEQEEDIGLSPDDEDPLDGDEEMLARMDRIHQQLLPVVDKQLRARGGLPMVKATYKRLTSAGIPKERVRELIAIALQAETTYMMTHRVSHDLERYQRFLGALPDLQAIPELLEPPGGSQAAAPLSVKRLERNEWRIAGDVPAAADDAFEAGMDALDAGNEKSAERYYRKAVAIAPDHIDALHHIALIAHRKNPRQALGLWEHAYERVTSVLPDALRDGGGHLRWGWIENRPFLRVCHGLVIARLDAGQAKAALELAERILRWNPDDNQGARALAVRAALLSGRADLALAICERFRDDLLVEVMYGRVLALFLTGDDKRARKAAGQAVRLRPLVAEELFASTHRPVERLPYGLTVGGADEAYAYWEEFGHFWASTPGALDLLREVRPAR